MGALSDAGANATLDAMLGTSHATTWPATVYVGLSTTDPGVSVTEPTGGAYARVAVTNNSTNFPAAVSRQKSNAATITFPTATGAWGTLTHLVLFTAATGGTLLASDALSASQSVLAGDVVVVPVAGLVVSM